MFRRLQNILCCVVIAGFAAVCWYGKNNGEAVMTGGTGKTTMDKPVVVIDPGHGGMDGGCVSVDGTPEKGINLAVAESLRDGLKLLGYDVVCTRESDISIYDKGTEGLGEQKKSDMKNRLAIFSKYSEGISVSIHQNQFTDSRYSGAQGFYAGTEGSAQLAKLLQERLVSTLNPGSNRKCKKSDGVYLMEHIDCTGVLIECGFLSNAEEEAKLSCGTYQKKLCCVIAATVSQYLSNT